MTFKGIKDIWIIRNVHVIKLYEVQEDRCKGDIFSKLRGQQKCGALIGSRVTSDIITKKLILILPRASTPCPIPSFQIVYSCGGAVVMFWPYP